ncbi:MAG: type II secretion system F family protein [Candidatus Caldarchaeum sp.]|nr:type II secretion system F family protein [Candidatus Caldarchaeum sp.]MDW8436019.1 type II secretion system F family protein [Candidatus Caldarchaeum sp.]
MIEQTAVRSVFGLLQSYWVHLSVLALVLTVLVSFRKLQNAEKRSNAEKEQTFFLTILYVMVKSGKTVFQSFKEAAARKNFLSHLSSVASYIVRDSESRTLAESMRRFVHPSKEFMLLMGSLGEDLEGGFGVVEKLEKLIEQAIMRETDRWRRYVETVETLGEVVVAVILLIPLVYIVGGLLGGFPLIYAVVIAVAAASVFYVVSTASEPLHLVDLPKWTIVVSAGLLLASGGLLFLGLLGFSPQTTGLAVAFTSLAWGLFVHFRYLRVSVAEGEAAFLLLDSVAARLRAGYPIGRSLETVSDPRYSRYALSVARGLSLRPFNRFMSLAMETVKIARLGGLGSEALGLLARLALAIHLSFTGARNRMKLYTALALGSGAAIVLVSAIVVLPFTQVPAPVEAEVQKLIIIPQIEPVLPLAMLVSYTLGAVVAKVEDQTIACTWRAGAGVLITLITYFIVQAFIPAQI